MNKLFAALIIPLMLADLAAAMGTAPAQKALPDLVVTEVTAKPLPVKGKTKLKIKFSIKNNGNTISPATKSVITITGDVIKSIDQTTPPLNPGQSFTATIDHDLAKAGEYEIKVSADYINKITESNENNNENKVRFSIGRAL